MKQMGRIKLRISLWTRVASGMVLFCVSFSLTKKKKNMKSPLRMAVALEKNNKVYPKDVRKFLMGLYATLHLTDNATTKDMEKLVYYAFRNGYLLGVKSEGGDDQKAYDRLPDLGVEEDLGNDIKR